MKRFSIAIIAITLLYSPLLGNGEQKKEVKKLADSFFQEDNINDYTDKIDKVIGESTNQLRP